MIWRFMHRWLGLTLGSVALLLALTGVILATYPAIDAFNAVPAASELSVATLAERITGHIAGVEQIRRLPSGDIVVYSFNDGQAQAARIDPKDGSVLQSWQPSAFARWVKNLHRSFLLGDAGRMSAAAVALGMLLISVSGLVLMARRQGGLRHLLARVRGSGLQRLHVVSGRIVLLVLLLTSLTALYMSAATFGWVSVESDFDPDVVSQASPTGNGTDLAPRELPLLHDLRVRDLRKLSVPAADDPEDTWQVATDHGEGWIDRYAGQTLAWQDASAAQRVYDWILLLHTGEGAWVWALVLGAMGASVPMFWVTGLLLWLQGRRQLPRIRDNSAVRDAEVLIFVASETGSTWGFAEALHRAFVHAGQRVHTGALEHFQVNTTAQQVFVLAATYGDGQTPAHAVRAIERIQTHPVGTATVTVLGFGDRQFTSYCGYAEAVDNALRARRWPQLLPLERIHQQSAQQFALWGETLNAALLPRLGQPLVIDYVPRVPATTTLTLVSRQDFTGELGWPAAILRFGWPRQSGFMHLAGRGLPRFAAGDLVGIVAPNVHVPRYYSLASSWRDGFLEICVRKFPDGQCSPFLHALQPGDVIQAFIKTNPGFALEHGRVPVLLIGAGTGVAPLAGFIRDNRRHTPMHLFFGARDPARDFYFGPEMERWLTAGQLATLRTAFSRVDAGGGYVQDALRRDAVRVQELMRQGAIVRVCGSRPMAQGVTEALNEILGAVKLNVQQLKARGRYAEDVF